MLLSMLAVRLRGPFAEVELHVGVRASDRPRWQDEHEALALLTPLFVHESPGLALRSLLNTIGERPDTLDDRALLQRVVRLVVRGDIGVTIHPYEPRTSERRSDELVLAPHEPVTPAPLEEADHWIEIALLDADGVALGGVRCEITLPEGRVVTRSTDRFGLIRLERLPMGGQATLRLLDLAD
jgi:hypothetical protein